MSPFDVASLKKELEDIDKEMQADGFWNDNEKAAKVMQKKKHVEKELDAYDKLNSAYDDLEVLIEMADEENDESLVPEIEADFKKLNDDIEDLRIETLLTGEYDHGDAVLSIHSGAGGVDAQDWANMLLRMYMRWCERKDYKCSIIDIQADDENGIKSATMMVEGENAYGYLKNERGVHRLVRISPFDSNARRHTSFASVDVAPQVDDDIEIEINPEDLRIDTYRSSGAGGQHVNTTDSAVRITHLPTNIVVSCQNERSQHQNREVAMRVLKSRLLELKEREHKEKIEELRGDYGQITWGNQIRSYVFQPYTMVKDHRTGAEVGDVQKVMDGDIDYFINEKLKQKDDK
ncbi:MAG: peptide chain release factor 2 [Anaerovoracaceae bacterium]|nr:peptide chain release factor 2 [Anaerovoracaceae bacterium]